MHILTIRVLKCLAACLMILLTSGCGLKLPSVTSVSAQITGDEPRTLAAATKAAQERDNRYRSGDYAGAWLLSSKQLHDAISQTDYVKYAQTCTTALAKLPDTVSGVRMDGDDHAIVREEVMGFKNSITMVYEDGKWVMAPDDFWIQNAGKPVQQTINEQKAAGKCGAEAPSSPAPTTTAEPTPATPIVGEVPGEPEAAAALRPWVRDLVSLSTAALVAKCWTIAPDSAKRMYADTTRILSAVFDPGVDSQFAVVWNNATTRISVRRSEIRSGYACPYVETNTGGNYLTPNDAEYIVQRYLSRVVGKPVNPDDVESKYHLECNNLPPVARQLLGKVTSFDANSIRSNGDLEYPVVTVNVNRAGSTRDIHVSFSGGIYGSDDVYCIANSD